jgi:hypothetical protein
MKIELTEVVKLLFLEDYAVFVSNATTESKIAHATTAPGLLCLFNEKSNVVLRIDVNNTDLELETHKILLTDKKKGEVYSIVAKPINALANLEDLLINSRLINQG